MCDPYWGFDFESCRRGKYLTNFVECESCDKRFVCLTR